MRRMLPPMLALFMLLAYHTPAQQLQPIEGKNLIVDIPVVARSGQIIRPQPLASATCGPDTLAYALNKATGLRTLNVNGSTSASAIAQYYDAPQPITISKVRFYAYKLNTAGGTTANMIIEIYNARPDSLPLGAPIQFIAVPVDTNYYGGTLSGLQKVATFNTPVTVTGPYIVAVRNNSPNPMAVVINDYTVMDGDSEWLGEAQISGTWRHGYQVNVGTTPFNCDVLLDPVCTYSLHPNFTSNPSCVATAGYSTFTNTSSPLLRHRMYSLAEFVNLGGLQVRWTFGDGSSSVRQVTNYDTTHYYGAAGNYNVTLTDSLIGWTMTCVADTTIQLGQAPIAAFSQTTNNLNVTFTNQSTNGPTSYLWTFGDGQTSTTQSPQHTYAIGGTYQVCMTATSACGTDSVCHSVTVSCPVPGTAFSTSANNLTVQFTDQTTGTGVNNWMWTFGDGGSSLIQNPSYTYANPGTYLVCLTTSNACGTDSTCFSLTVTCPTPAPAFTQGGTGLTINFTDQSTGTVTGYFWEFGDGNTATTQNPTHTYASAGNYQVCLTTTNTCGDDSTCRHIDIPLVGIPNGISTHTIHLSPNPASTWLRIEFSLPTEDPMTLHLYNMMGVQLKSIDPGPSKSQSLQINIADLPQGSYWLQLSTTSGTIGKRVTILR